jgi:hypothetical protein
MGRAVPQPSSLAQAGRTSRTSHFPWAPECALVMFRAVFMLCSLLVSPCFLHLPVSSPAGFRLRAKESPARSAFRLVHGPTRAVHLIP